MLKLPFKPFAFCLFFTFFSAFSWAISAEKPPSVPTFSEYHWSTKVQNSNEVILQHFISDYHEIAYYRWDALTGKATKLPVPKNVSSYKMIKTKQGYYFFGNFVENQGKYKPELPKYTPYKPAVAFLSADGKVVTANLPQFLTYVDNASLTLLADQSVLIVGGKDIAGKRLSTMGRVSFFNNQLKYESLPNLPFNSDRSRYSLVGLVDGRAMVLGGETYNAIGCHQCLNETYFYDPKTKKWQHGPNMLEKRNEATATLLPNGNVLVVGGWTPTTSENWGQWGTVSPSTEIWDAKTNKFVQGGKLVSGTTMHEVTWLAGHEGKQLLIAGGKSSVVQLYDIDQNTARLVEVLNEYQSDYRANKTPISFMFNQQLYAWLNATPSGGQAKTNWHLVSVKLGKNGEEPIEQLDIKQDIVLNINRFKFLPGEANQPSYIIGGHPPESATDINTIRAIWPDGRMQVVPNAPASVETVDISSLPPLNRPRQNYNRDDVAYKKLADGRVIVAGGMVQANKIAIADADSMDVDGQDTYKSVGQFYPARRHETYDPSTKQWRDSAPSIMPGRRATVLNDGRVVKVGKIEDDTELKDCQNKRKVIERVCRQPSIEISNTEGTAWEKISLESIPLTDIGEDETRLFVIQDELFLAGNHIVEIEENRHSTTDITLWYNTQTKQWETLWESKSGDSYSEHVGRIIFRQLANGKRVVLPVHGF